MPSIFPSLNYEGSCNVEVNQYMDAGDPSGKIEGFTKFNNIGDPQLCNTNYLFQKLRALKMYDETDSRRYFSHEVNSISCHPK